MNYKKRLKWCVKINCGENYMKSHIHNDWQLIWNLAMSLTLIPNNKRNTEYNCKRIIRLYDSLRQIFGTIGCQIKVTFIAIIFIFKPFCTHFDWICRRNQLRKRIKSFFYWRVHSIVESQPNLKLFSGKIISKWKHLNSKSK